MHWTRNYLRLAGALALVIGASASQAQEKPQAFVNATVLPIAGPQMNTRPIAPAC